MEPWEEIRAKMEELGISQPQLAARLGTSQQNVERVVNGKVRHSRFLRPIRLELGLPDTSVHLTRSDTGDPIERLAVALEIIALHAGRISAALERQEQRQLGPAGVATAPSRPHAHRGRRAPDRG